MASPGRSLTGSLLQGVSAFSRLLRDQVYPAPSVDTWKPKPRFAITLIHGAGVTWPPVAATTYSRPCAANPPRPLKYSRSRGPSTSAEGMADAVDGRRKARGAAV